MGLSILKDIVTAIRGGANEVGESIVDSQAIRILAQEIRDAEEGILSAKSSLSKLKAREIQMKKEIFSIKDDLDGYTSAAKAALSDNNNDLAREIAGKIGELRNDLAEKEGQQSVLSSEVNKIYDVIKKREKIINKNKTEMEKAKTIDELNKTNKAISSAMPTTENSAKRVNRALDRVKQKQADFANNSEAEEWLEEKESGGDLDKRIAAAGLTGGAKNSADDILAELSG